MAISFNHLICLFQYGSIGDVPLPEIHPEYVLDVSVDFLEVAFDSS